MQLEPHLMSGGYDVIVPCTRVDGTQMVTIWQMQLGSGSDLKASAGEVGLSPAGRCPHSVSPDSSAGMHMVQTCSQINNRHPDAASRCRPPPHFQAVPSGLGLVKIICTIESAQTGHKHAHPAVSPTSATENTFNIRGVPRLCHSSGCTMSSACDLGRPSNSLQVFANTWQRYHFIVYLCEF